MGQRQFPSQVPLPTPALDPGDLSTQNARLRATCADLEQRLARSEALTAALKQELAQKARALDKESVQRKRAEDALVFSRKQLRALLDASSDILFRMSPDWSRLYHLIGRNFLADIQQPTVSWLERFVPAEEQRRLQLTLQKAIRTKSAFELEHKVVLKDGSRGHVRTRALPILDETGEISEWLGLASDITRSEFNKQELERLNLLMREGERIAQLGSWEFLVSTGEMTWSEGQRRIYGIAKEQRLPNYRELLRCHLPREDAIRMIDALQHAVATGARFNLEHRILQPDGSERTVQELALPRFDRTGRVMSYVGVTRDVTESKDAEDRLRASERRFRELFENLPIAYHATDEHGRWIDANLQMAHLLGFDKPEDMLGLSFLDYWDASAECYQGNLESFHRADQAEIELCLMKQDCTPLTVLASCRRQRDSSNAHLRTHSILIDITERRLMEDEIRALNQNLERRVASRTAEAVAANNAKSEFLAQMSHEIRTPLHVILGSAQILAMDEQLDAARQQQIAQIEDAGETLLALLTDILDFSKIEAGKVSITPQPVDVTLVLKRIGIQLAPAAREKGLSFCIESPQEHSLGVRADALRLQQVLANLIGNAIKFTDAGGIRLRVEEQKTRGERKRLRFTVEDSGIGIEPLVIGRLFQPFAQGDPMDTRGSGGAGLGLVICKRLIELMGGQIGVWSKPGRGSRFWFDLPAADLPETTVLRAVTSRLAPGAVGARLTGWHLLIVDDSLVSQQVMKTAVQQYGASATLVDDGRQAVDALRQAPEAFQAVLMDVRMPVMDGLSATRLIRTKLGLGNLPIIGISAGALARERDAALVAGMNAVLAKPVRFEELVNTILRCSTTTGEAPTDERHADEEHADSSTALVIASARTPLPDVPDAEVLRGSIHRIADPERALTTKGPDPQAVHQRLLELFRAESADVEETVQQDLASGSRAAAANRLHKLKGAACIIGAQTVFELSGNLETAIALGETDLDEPIGRLGQALRDIDA